MPGYAYTAQMRMTEAYRRADTESFTSAPPATLHAAPGMNNRLAARMSQFRVSREPASRAIGVQVKLLAEHAAEFVAQAARQLVQ